MIDGLLMDERDEHLRNRAFKHGNRVAIKEGGKFIALARFLIGCPSGLVVDHISGDPLDNRRSNLRICTIAQNGMNKRPHRFTKSGSKTSRFKGVCWYAARGKWLASVKRDYKNHYLGLFHCEEAAAHAYDAKARELHGQFAALNFPNDGETAATPDSVQSFPAERKVAA